MLPPPTDLVLVRDIPNAGRGVVATQRIAKGTLIMRSAGPAAHVVMRTYRKETCARCFYYDRGRTLPVRDATTGKVFCSQECELAWQSAEGALGVAAWRNLHTFVQSRRPQQPRKNDHSVVAHGHDSLNGSLDGHESRGDRDINGVRRPSARDVHAAWEHAADFVSSARTKTLRRAVANGAADPDIMGFYLDGLLLRHRRPEIWWDAVGALTLDEEPYLSAEDLQDHSIAFQQMAAMAWPEGFPNVDSHLCRFLDAAASHNAFGIRAGGEDNEEYMGFAVYPEASFFNHSCSPNVAKKRVGRRWEMRAARDIAADEECCITYLGGDEVGLDITARGTRLKTAWGFLCMCQKCRQESKDDCKQNTTAL